MSEEVLINFNGFVGESNSVKIGITKELNLSLRKGQIGVFIDTKVSSELFKLLSGLGQILEGELDIFGQGYNKESQLDPSMEVFRNIGFGFKDKGLFSNKSLFLNVDLPARYHGHYAHGMKEGQLATKALEEINVDNTVWESRPDFVSWYIKKRVLLARAVVMNPKIVLLDDPTVSIPWEYYPNIVEWLFKQREKQCGIMISTDNLPFAYSIADWVWDEREGLIEKKDFNNIDKQIIRSAEALKERFI